MVLLSGQPTGRGAEKTNLASTNRTINAIKSKVQLTVDRRFGLLVKGFSAWVDSDDVSTLEAQPGVAAVHPVRAYKPLDDTANELTGANAARRTGLDGRGTVVSIVDTGIDIHHQDMRLDADGAASAKLTATDGFTAKVPYGYNFADRNGNVKDTTSSQHGMHVAGIVAANGGSDADPTTNGRVNGAAPEAQLLAMKVFSNDPAKSGSAYTDDIVAAIEESVRRGADVINMSLGSADGTDSADQGEGLAIANAQKAGVQVVVAAGNEGLSSSASGNESNDLELLDSGSLGSPASAPGAWSVASINNTKKVDKAATVKWDGGTMTVGYQQQAGPTDTDVHELVSIGLGKPEEVPASVKGKWALAQRGELSFADKVKNAVAKGATGVIIFNHAAGGDDIPGMAGVDDATVPVAGMGHTAGQKIADLLTSGKTVTIQLSPNNSVSDNPNALQASSFTSWGATPDLNFKPEIAGIGGSVYSTLNDNKYGVMSGTSMATPNVAGVTALMVQSIKKNNPGISSTEADTRLRTAVSNTAEILKKDGLPLAPRQIGAGLAQADKAAATRVLATVAGRPNIALKEITSPRNVTVTLTNTGDKARTFTTSQTCALLERHEIGKPFTECSTTEKAATTTRTITVPAHGTADVSWTITPAAGEAHWLEGWLMLHSTDPAQPDLSVPYMGFVGDWNKEPIIDTPVYDTEPSLMQHVFGKDNPHKTVLASKLGSTTYDRGVGANYFSPNGDGTFDTIFPKLMLLRSAQEAKFSIVDANGKVVRELGSERDYQHPLLSKIIETTSSMAESATDRKWDGTVWDAKKAEFVTAPEGKYSFKVQARLSKNFAWQNVTMPFTLDVTAPTLTTSVSTNSDGATSVVVKVTDSGSGVVPAGITARDGQGNKLVADTTSVPGSVVFPVANPSAARSVDVRAVDRAGNTSEKTVMLAGTAVVTPDALMQGTVVNTDTPDRSTLTDTGDKTFLRSDKTLPVRGSVSDAVAKVTVNGVDATISADRHFEAMVGWTEGHNTYEIVALDSAGKVLDRTSTWVDVDLKGPQLTADAPRGDDNLVTIGSDGTVTVKGNVSDDQARVGDTRRPLTLTVDGKKVSPDSDGSFTATVKPKTGQTQVVVSASDGVNTSVVALPLDLPVASDGALRITFDDDAMADDSNPFGQQDIFLDKDDKFVDPSTSPRTYTVSGTFNRAPKSFTIDGKEVKLDSKLHFAVKVPISQGLTKVGYTVTAPGADAKTLESAWRIFYDTRIPGIQLDSPTIAEDGAAYIPKPSDDITFAGSVWDNAFGYELALNGNIVTNFNNVWDPGARINKQAFSQAVTASDGDRILLGLYDLMGNGMERVIPVISDGEAPKVDVEGVKAGEVLSSPTTIKVVASDAHLRNMKVTLDGKEVAFKETEVTPAEGAETTIVGEPDDTASTGSNSTNGSRAVAAKAAAAQASVDARARAANAGGTKAATGEGHTVLTFTLPTDSLAAGNHALAVTATDRADHRTDVAVPFTIDAAPRIEGPDAITVNPDENVLDQIRKAYTVVDDLDKNLVVNANLSGLVLDKAVPVTLTAIDSAGHVAMRTVKVTLQRPLTTLKGECGSMTARFATSDSITITCTTRANGDVAVKVENKGPAVVGTLTLNVPTDRKVLVVENGKVVGEAKAQIVDGKVVLTAPSSINLLLPKNGKPGGKPNLPSNPGHNGGSTGHGNTGGNGGSTGGGNTGGNGSNGGQHNHFGLPSTGGDPATGLTGLAGLAGLGAVISMAVAAARKSRH